MVPGRRYSPRYVFSLLWRRGLYGLVPLVLVTAVTLLLVRSLPDVYYAQGVVSIIRQQVPENYIRTTVTTPFAERLRTTSEALRDPARLTALIEEFDLYSEARRTVPIEGIVAWMARSIRIELTRPDTVIVGYAGYDREVVQKVADRLTQAFIDEMQEDRAALADTTSQFLDAELAAARARLQEQERRVQAYREKYAGQLPTQVGTNLQILQGVYTQLQGNMEALRQDRERRTQLQEQVTQLRAELAAAQEKKEEEAAAPPPDADGPPSTEVVPGAPEIPPGPIGQRLRVARRLLAAMLERYTPEHPDAVRLKDAVTQLEKLAAQQARPTTVTQADGTEVLEDPRITALEAELKRLDARIAEREAQEAQQRTTVQTYQGRVEAVPARESEWQELTRDYATMEAGYAALLAKTQESRLAANLEKQRFGEQLKISGKPFTPSAPISPNRPRMLMIGLGLGVFLFLGIITLFELLDTGLRGESEVTSTLRVPVLAMLPVIVTPEHQRRTRLRLAVASAITLAVVVLVAFLRWS